MQHQTLDFVSCAAALVHCSCAQLAKIISYQHWKRWKAYDNSSSEKCSTLLHLNLTGYLLHLTQTIPLWREMKRKPFIISLNNTCFTKAINTMWRWKYINYLAGAIEKCKCGDVVIVFILDKYCPRATVAEQFSSAERIWAGAHSDSGQDLICCWHPPPNPGSIESIAGFETEYNRHKQKQLESSY